MDPKALLDVNHIVHLAGCGIADKRWTAGRKKEIISSRVDSARLLFEHLDHPNHSVSTFVSASGVGYYGAITANHELNETDDVGNDYIGNVCEQWEDAADEFATRGIRVVKLRTGVVLAKNGGALEKLEKVIGYRIGSPLGTGKQFMPWIHIEDICRMYQFAIENKEIIGAFNAVAPDYVDNKQFMKTIAHYLHRKLWLPNVPKFALNLVLGEMAILLLTGSKISSNKIIKHGFSFNHKTFDEAMSEIYGLYQR